MELAKIVLKINDDKQSMKQRGEKRQRRGEKTSGCLRQLIDLK